MKLSKLHSLLMHNGYTLLETEGYKLYKSKNGMNYLLIHGKIRVYHVWDAIVDEQTFINTLKPIPQVIPLEVMNYSRTLNTGEYKLVFQGVLYHIVVSSNGTIKIYETR